VQLLTSNFTGSLGPGAGQVRWEGSGGFAAQGADRTVRLNNSTAAIDWDAEYFVGEDNTLILGASNANRTLIWDKGLNINVWEARIRVVNGTAPVTRAEAVIQQAIEGWGNLVVEGNGRLDITQDNSNFTGEILISGAELRLNRAGRFGAVNNIKIEAGGTLTLDNRGTHTGPAGGQYVANRLNTAAGSQIELAGGTLQHIGQTNTSTTTTLPVINLAEGSNTIDVINPTVGRFTEVQTKLNRATGATSTVNFTTSSGSGTFAANGNAPRFKLTNVISDFISSFAGAGDLIGWATVNGTHFARIQDGYIVPYMGPYTSFPSSSFPNENGNYLVSSSVQNEMGSVMSINSLTITGNSGLFLPSLSTGLRIQSGGIILRDYAVLNIQGALVGSYYKVQSGGDLHQGHLYIHVPGVNSITGLYTSALSTNFGLRNVHARKTGPGGLALRLHTTGSVTVSEGRLNALNAYPKLIVEGGSLAELLTTEKFPEVILRNSSSQGGAILKPMDGARIDVLRVESIGVLDFGLSPRELFVDTLNIDIKGDLIVRNWVDSVTRFLVRKTSLNLENMLTRVRFEGYDGLTAGTRAYSDNAYWEIFAAPEPTTYGAIFGAVGIGLVVWRRKRRSMS